MPGRSLLRVMTIMSLRAAILPAQAAGPLRGFVVKYLRGGVGTPNRAATVKELSAEGRLNTVLNGHAARLLMRAALFEPADQSARRIPE
jgi:hypothetical protein